MLMLEFIFIGFGLLQFILDHFDLLLKGSVSCFLFVEILLDSTSSGYRFLCQLLCFCFIFVKIGDFQLKQVHLINSFFGFYFSVRFLLKSFFSHDLLSAENRWQKLSIFLDLIKVIVKLFLLFNGRIDFGLQILAEFLLSFNSHVGLFLGLLKLGCDLLVGTF